MVTRRFSVYKSTKLQDPRDTAPSQCFRYVDGTWVRIRAEEVQAFTEHINSMDRNIKLTPEDVKKKKTAWLLLDCAVQTEDNSHTQETKHTNHSGVVRDLAELNVLVVFQTST